MDQMDSATADVSTLSASNTTTSNGRIVWPDGPAMIQNFSISEKIIYYMARNPKSPEVYLKLAMSCKYFFEKLPLLITKRIVVEEDGTRMCTSKTEEECKNNEFKCCVNIDIGKLTTSKIWLTHLLKFRADVVPESSILLKIYQCKDARIMFYESNISLKDLEVWASAFTKFGFCMGKIIDGDAGGIATIDSMLKVIPNVKEFSYIVHYKESVTPTTMKNILQLKNLDKLELLYLVNIPEIAVEDFSAFIKTYKNTRIRIHFSSNISAQYKIQLDELIHDVIASEVPNRLICYPDQNDDTLKTMKERYH